MLLDQPKHIMTEIDLQTTREYVAAKELEHSLNSFGWKPEVFAQAVKTYHRTLQQELFRTIVATIKVIASDDNWVDGRNRASHETAKAIVESGVLEDTHLPFI